jgi:hypothetical protein
VASGGEAFNLSFCNVRFPPGTDNLANYAGEIISLSNSRTTRLKLSCGQEANIYAVGRGVVIRAWEPKRSVSHKFLSLRWIRYAPSGVVARPATKDALLLASLRASAFRPLFDTAAEPGASTNCSL